MPENSQQNTPPPNPQPTSSPVPQPNGIDKLEELSIQNIIEVVKQLIWICSGFSIFILTSLFAYISTQNQFDFILVLPSISLIPFAISIIYSILFFLSLVARTAFHKDADIFADSCKRNVKVAFWGFILGITIIILSIFIILINKKYYPTNTEPKKLQINVPAEIIYNKDTNKVRIKIDSLSYILK
jgi:hypothetical protein